jgi:hypothetical protein
MTLILVLFVLIFLSPFLLLIFYRQKRVVVRHPQSGLTKNGYYGFSPTYLCFGWFVPLFRGEIGIAALHLIFSIFTFGIWQLIASFIYNRQYTVWTCNGFAPVTDLIMPPLLRTPAG